MDRTVHLHMGTRLQYLRYYTCILQTLFLFKFNPYKHIYVLSDVLELQEFTKYKELDIEMRDEYEYEMSNPAIYFRFVFRSVSVDNQK